MSRIGKNIKKARSEKGYTQEQLAQKLSVTRNTISNYETGHSNPDIEMLQMLAEALETDPNTLIYGEKKSQSVDQVWRKEILKRIAWLIIAGAIMMISSSLMKYGNEIAKDTLRVPFWNSWLLLTAYPLAFVIIGMQLMSLAWRACGKRITEHRWTKVVFWILIAAFILWVIAVTADSIRYEYAWRLYEEASKNLGPDESLPFHFSSRIFGFGLHIYVFYKWLWVLGWGAYGMVLAILNPEKRDECIVRKSGSL